MGNTNKRCLGNLGTLAILAGFVFVWAGYGQDLGRRNGSGRQQEMSPTTTMDGNSSLSVHVVNASGGDLPTMVHVELFRGDDGSGRGPFMDGYCDSKGYYGFSGLRRGTYWVAVSVPGYLPQRYEVDLDRDDQQELTAQLRRLTGGANDSATVSVQQLGIPEKARHKYEKGYELYQHKDYNGAVKQFQEALQIDSNYALAQNQLALAYWRLDKPDDARQWFETAIRSDPKFLLPYLNFAELLSQQKEYEHAAAVLKQASDAAPYQGEPYYLMGKLQYDLGQPERAEAALNQALKRDTSKIPEVHVLLANVYVRLHQAAKVATQLQAYLAVAPHGIYAKAVREQLAKLKQEEPAGNSKQTGE